MEIVWASTLLGIVVLSWILMRRKQNNLPPLYSGWIPWLGCAFEFGRAPVLFIEEKRKEVRSVTKESFFTYHTSIHDAVKGKLAASQLSQISDGLFHEFKKHLHGVSTGGCQDLHSVVRRVMYKAVMTNLFGEHVLPTASEAKFAELEEHFIRFDDQFEYGARLPAFFLKDWNTSKQWLLSLFNGVVNRHENSVGNTDKETLLGCLIGMVDRHHAPNYSLLLLWASLANAIPITFWTLALMMNDQDVMKKAQSEIEFALSKSTHINEEVLRKMPYLKMCMLEAIRMRSPGVVTRRVVKSFTVKGYEIPEGDMLMVSPYWTHRNPKYFDDPNTFNPDRWNREDLDKNIFPEVFIAFGGGRYQCPGRWFALLEIHMFIALFLQRFNCKLLGPIPEASTLHVVGTQQPAGSCDVEFSIKALKEKNT